MKKRILFRRLYWFICLFVRHRWEYYDRGKDDDHVKLFCTKCFRIKEFNLKDIQNLRFNPLNKWDSGYGSIPEIKY